MSDRPIQHIIEDNEGLAAECGRLQSDLTAAKAENEALRGRVAELEEGVKAIFRIADHPPKDHLILEISQRIVSGKETSSWLLRKQAEAVEELTEDYEAKVGRGTYIWKGYAVDFSQRLRQQADELEND